DPDGEIEEQDVDNNWQWSAIAGVQVDRSTLGEAVSNLDLEWTTGGDAVWFAQGDETAQADPLAAKSPPLATGESAWFEATVSGPAFVRFDWKSETQSRDNYLVATLDGVEQARISGTTDWHEEGFLVSATSSRLRFTYVNDGTTDGSDAAWVSGIRIEPVDGPDLVVTGIEYPAGSYVLQSAI